LNGSAAGPAKSDETYYFLKHAQAVTGPAAGPAAKAMSFDTAAQSIDLGSLASQHRPAIA
jgi:hypothetical protein